MIHQAPDGNGAFYVLGQFVGFAGFEVGVLGLEGCLAR